MGIICSKIEEIDSLRWTQPKKGKVLKATRVMFVDEQTAIIELSPREYTVAGRLHSPNGNWAVIGYGLDKFQSSVLDGLARLGILTKEQVSSHKANEKARRERQKRYYAIENLKRNCEALGIAVPAIPTPAHQPEGREG